MQSEVGSDPSLSETVGLPWSSKNMTLTRLTKPSFIDPILQIATEIIQNPPNLSENSAGSERAMVALPH